MNVTKNVWYARWFRYNCLVIDRFLHNNVDYSDGEVSSPRLYRYRNGTDLCQFMRTLVFGTLATLATIVWYGLVVATVISPFYLMGTVKVTIILGIVVAFIAALCALIYFLLEVFPKMVYAVGGTLREMVTPPPVGNPGMMVIIWQWIKGIKNKFCPTITFKS